MCHISARRVEARSRVINYRSATAFRVCHKKERLSAELTPRTPSHPLQLSAQSVPGAPAAIRTLPADLTTTGSNGRPPAIHSAKPRPLSCTSGLEDQTIYVRPDGGRRNAVSRCACARPLRTVTSPAAVRPQAIRVGLREPDYWGLKPPDTTVRSICHGQQRSHSNACLSVSG